jgi:molecular chaperone HtpG
MDENDPTVQMQHMLKAMGQKELPDFKPILKINPDHEIIKKIDTANDSEFISDLSILLLEQAKLLEGETVKKPVDFVKTLNRILGRL